MGGQSSGSQTRLWYQKGRVYARLAVCMWASVSVRRAALCAASVSSWGGTVRNARVLHMGCRLANTARLRARRFSLSLAPKTNAFVRCRADVISQQTKGVCLFSRRLTCPRNERRAEYGRGGWSTCAFALWPLCTWTRECGIARRVLDTGPPKATWHLARRRQWPNLSRPP